MRLLLLVILCTLLTACTTVGGWLGRTPPAGTSPSEAAGQAPGLAPATAQAGEDALTSDDLFSIYRAAMTGYVDTADSGALIRGALNGARAGALDAGLLPLETAALDAVPLETSGDPQRDWAPFGTAYDAFVGKLGTRMDVGSVGRAAARGMLGALNDPLTEYLERDTVQAMVSPRYAGAGLVLAPAAARGQTVVRQVVADGPADRAGVRVGDVIMAVDGKSMQDVNLFDVLRYLGGPAGTAATVSVSAGGSEPARNLEITRAPVRPPAVTSSVRDGVVYFQLLGFDQASVTAVRRALLDSTAAGARGWLIDLRGNGEGSLEEAVNLTSLFTGEQPVMIQEARGGRQNVVPGTREPLSGQLPLVLLIDGATAGPAELFAGALSDYHLATLVGTPTAGRLGSATTVGLSDGSAAQVTTGRMLSPSGIRLLGTGVPPNESVPADPAALAAGEDPALARALALFR